jgi:hypothetical protein
MNPAVEEFDVEDQWLPDLEDLDAWRAALSAATKKGASDEAAPSISL